METHWCVWIKNIYILIHTHQCVYFLYELTILFSIFLASSMFCPWNVYCSSKGTGGNICELVEHICIILNTKTAATFGPFEDQSVSQKSVCIQKVLRPENSIKFFRGLPWSYGRYWVARQTPHWTSFFWHNTLNTNFKFPHLSEFKIQNRKQTVESFPVLHISMWTGLA